MEERVRNAAEEGDIEALYRLLREKSDLLRDIDEMEFVDTPLHIAAMLGHTEFAKEFMDLKPSFARKLNQDGLSPMHLALQNGHTKTVLSLLTFDKDLVRVKGKNGFTPLHYACKTGNSRVLAKFLKNCPDCIHDVTNRNETAFHLAAHKKDFEAFRILLPWLWSSDFSMKQIKRILNSKNKDGDTVLHIAASNNQPKILKILTTYRIINLKATNSKNLTALGILKGGSSEEDNKKCVDILRSAQRLNAVLSISVFLVLVISQLAYNVRHMSGDDTNALLVVTVLILTTTYQATLSPPGGVFPPPGSNDKSDNTTTSTALEIHLGWKNFTSYHLKKQASTPGSSVLGTADFLWFFIPNIAAFCLSFLVTCFVLIVILPRFFSSILVAALSTLLFCLLVSTVRIISPNAESLNIVLQYVYLLVYFLYFAMGLILVVVLIKRLRKRIFEKQYMRTNSKHLGPEA